MTFILLFQVILIAVRIIRAAFEILGGPIRRLRRNNESNYVKLPMITAHFTLLNSKSTILNLQKKRVFAV